MIDKLLKTQFRKVNGVVWDLTTGKIGVKKSDQIFSLDGEFSTDPNTEDDIGISVNVLDDFGIAIPAFAQNTPVDSIQLGDLIYGATGPLGWVVKKNEKSFELLKPEGTRSRWTPPKVKSLMFDQHGAMVLRSLINMFGGSGKAEEGLLGLQNSMLPLLMMTGDDNNSLLSGKFDKMIPFMLMSGGFGGSGSSLSNGGMVGNLFQMMMMMKLMGGNENSSNPLKDMMGKSFFD